MVPYDETEHLYTLIHKIFRKLRNPKFDSPDKNLVPSITRVQWWVLKILLEQKQCTAGYLAKKIGVRPNTMSEMLNRLETEGYITRSADVADARVRNIRLTAQGKDIFNQSESKFIEQLAGPLEYLTPQKRQMLISLMEELVGYFPRQNHD